MDQDGNPRFSNGQYESVNGGGGGGSSASSPREGSPEVMFRFARSHHANHNGGHLNEDSSNKQKSQQKTTEQQQQRKHHVRYRECQKNHVANIGGHAIDGCGEFLPSGKEGTLEALICAVCSCHRNFHRREFVGPDGEYTCTCGGIGKDSGNLGTYTLTPSMRPLSPRVREAKGHHQQISSADISPHAQMIMPLAQFDDQHYEDDDDDDDDDDEPPEHPRPLFSKKKRFRTKFTADQKERMSNFAETLGWRISKHDEASLLEFCNDVGVKRNVFKVWMHNNKHTSARKQ